nr:MAG TPA: hypothetical protein [Caudoviricetes sp.]
MPQAPPGVFSTRRGFRDHPGGACDTPGGCSTPGGSQNHPRGW